MPSRRCRPSAAPCAACSTSGRRRPQPDPDCELLQKFSCNSAVTIVHLIYRKAAYDTHAQDYEFSRFSVEEHWQAGRNDMRRTLRHRKWRQRTKPTMGVHILDLAD